MTCHQCRHLCLKKSDPEKRCVNIVLIWHYRYGPDRAYCAAHVLNVVRMAVISRKNEETLPE